MKAYCQLGRALLFQDFFVFGIKNQMVPFKRDLISIVWVWFSFWEQLLYTVIQQNILASVKLLSWGVLCPCRNKDKLNSNASGVE